MVNQTEDKTTAAHALSTHDSHQITTRKVALIIIGVAVVFGLGMFVGDGRIALNKPSALNSQLPATLNYSTVNAVYNALKVNYNGKLTETQLLDGMKHGLATATNDPYTEYFTASEATAFSNELQGTFTGIGVELGQTSDGSLQVIAPIAGTPAAKAGLKAQDIITAINGKTTTGMSIDSAVDAVRGNAGTTVSLSILRGQQNLSLTITRANFNVPSVTSKMLPNTTIGYIAISQFSDDTAGLTRSDAAQLQQKGARSIILDLRGNPGGELTAADGVSSLWLNSGQVILQEKHGTQVIDTERASGENILHGVPTVVLIDGGSASASEITAAALHDNKDATLIGMKSYGKGVVQNVISFPDGSELKVTIASWYRPDGQDINKKGIIPDMVVNQSSADTTAGVDDQLNAAIHSLQSNQQ
jgi:carboxyl-terminal processing protease